MWGFTAEKSKLMLPSANYLFPFHKLHAHHFKLLPHPIANTEDIYLPTIDSEMNLIGSAVSVPPGLPSCDMRRLQIGNWSLSFHTLPFL